MIRSFDGISVKSQNGWSAGNYPFFLYCNISSAILIEGSLPELFNSWMMRSKS